MFNASVTLPTPVPPPRGGGGMPPPQRFLDCCPLKYFLNSGHLQLAPHVSPKPQPWTVNDPGTLHPSPPGGLTAPSKVDVLGAHGTHPSTWEVTRARSHLGAENIHVADNFTVRCRAKMAHLRWSKPEAGLGLQIEVLKRFKLFPLRLKAVRAGRWRGGQHKRAYDILV